MKIVAVSCRSRYVQYRDINEKFDKNRKKSPTVRQKTQRILPNKQKQQETIQQTMNMNGCQ